MNSQPMIAVADVEAASAWYQRVLGFESGHGGPEYEQLMSQGKLVLQLHDWNVHEQPHLGDPAHASRGNGVVLWFETDRFDDTWRRIQAAAAEVLEAPHVNPLANHREVWLRDPNGYVIVVSGPLDG